MKQIVPEYAFSQAQLNSIAALARQTGLTENITRILYARGVDTEEKIRAFMHPSSKNFLDPYLMKGMKEAVLALVEAREMQKTVAVFGDYDADGICASAIMYHALKDFGIDAHVYVPEREDGYGLSFDVVDKIFDDCNPELFITVDCGISCAKEAQYIFELGCDVIVTDHHELPEELPDCIIINPKLKDDYPYDNLCGAGVVFKLACALIGEKAYEYLDFATLATVADSVPLLGENRDIVTEGLKLFNRDPRPCFAALLNKTYDGVTAQTLAFTLAPRINAAGRMGDAQAAFRLFITDKEAEVYDLATQLCLYNTERQKCCDELYACAKEKLKKKGAFGNVIMLWDESWNAGFIGIVAARIAEEFGRPTMLFVQHGDMLKGSARSIESVNIFSALKNCQEYIEEFGGHAQAAGINVKTENFDALERALSEEISRTYTQDDFVQKVCVCEEVTSTFSEKFAKELMALEPYGVGHRKPLFSLSVAACQTRPIKPYSPHLSIRCDYLDLMYFSGAKHLNILQSDVQKKIIFEVGMSKFRGKESVKGYVKELLYDGRTGAKVERECFRNALSVLSGEKVETDVELLTQAEIEGLIAQATKECAYGTCLIAMERESVEKYPSLAHFSLDLFYPSSRNLSNALIVSPAADADLSGFCRFIFLDTPPAYQWKALEGKKTFVNSEACGYTAFRRLDCDRETLLCIYAALKRDLSLLSGATVEEVAASCKGLGFDENQFVFALKVFEQLGLVSFQEGKLTVYRGVKTDLLESALYAGVLQLQDK